jgi:hypothetical protein
MYLYYHWIQQSIIPRVVRRSNSFSFHKFQQVERHCNVKYTPTTYTTTIDVNLKWGDFEKLYVTISSNPFLENHAFEHYADLTHFLQFWDSYMRFKYIPFVRPNQTPRTCWRLGPRGKGLAP